MTRAHSVEAVRRAEAAADPDLAAGSDRLMTRAAAGVAAVVAGELRRGPAGGAYGARVALLVGPGNNGGDALHAGARLAARGAQVVALRSSERVHAGGLAALLAAGGRVVEDAGAARALAAADVVVDGLLGAGARPGLDERAAALVAAVPASALVVAVDLPSGIDPESGELPDGPCVHADVTVALGSAKPALLLPPAGGTTAGRLVVVDIGLDPRALGEPAVTELDAAGAAALWPVPGRDDDKYSRGVLGVVAGGDTYTGAALLCVGAAVRGGAGMVRYVGPPRPTDLVRQRFPEVVPGAGRVQAWAAGSGVDPDDAAQAGAVAEVLRAAVEDGVPCLLDAGALPALVRRVREHGPLDPSRSPVLLTPHAGELARLLTDLGTGPGGPGGRVARTDVAARPLAHARAAALATGATVLLKGSTTVVVEPAAASGARRPGPRVRAQTDGPGWLGTAGAGDVLAGVAGVLLAAGLDPLDAGSLATAVHGRAAAAASAGGPLHAEAVAEALARVVAHLLTTGEWP